jgi:hypothetical protein
MGKQRQHLDADHWLSETLDRWRTDHNTPCLWPASSMLDAIEELFPHLDHDLILTPEDFAAAFRRWLALYTNGDGSISAEDIMRLRRMLAPWKAVITQLETEINRK